MANQPRRDAELLHQFRNHLGVILGYCDLLMSELPDTDPKHRDLGEVQKAARAALALVPELEKPLRENQQTPGTR